MRASMSGRCARGAIAFAGVAAVLGMATGGGANAAPAGEVHLPDLIAVEPVVVREVQQCLGGAGSVWRNPCSLPDGTNFISFSTIPANLGNGPLELRSEINPQDKTTSIAYQRFYTHNAKNRLEFVSESPVGTFDYHPSHRHFHFGGYAELELRTSECFGADSSCVGGVVSTSEKIGFCLVSSGKTDESSLEHFASRTPYRDGRQTCMNRNGIQGISVGWYDEYQWSLPDQHIALPPGLPDGHYWLVQRVDAENRLTEINENNNESRVLLFLGEVGDFSAVFPLCKVAPINYISQLTSKGYRFARPCT
jgi:hypothetical protein